MRARDDREVAARERNRTDSLTLRLPEPPTMNVMIGHAKKRDRRGRPTIYSKEQHKYRLLCSNAALSQGFGKPREPWKKWRLVSAHFDVFNMWDWNELPAGLKWVLDWLIEYGVISDDSPREMEKPTTWPTQTINRKDRGVTITLERII